MPKRFRFGVTLTPGAEGRREWRDRVRRIEAAGFAIVTVTDHFGGSAGVFGPLVAAYEAAPSLRVGSLVVNSDVWNPAMLAREVIATEIMTDGAFELGLGAGWDIRDYRATGLAREPAAVRVSRLAESVSILGPALSGSPVRYGGNHYSIELEPLPAPVQRHIPLLIGGGSRRVLELAARTADIVSVHRSLEHGVRESWVRDQPQGEGQQDPTADRVSWIRTSAGRRFEQLELHALVYRVVVTDNRERGVQDLSEAFDLDVSYVETSPHFLVGSEHHIVDELRRRRELWGISYLTLVGDSDVAAFAPIVQQLAGS